MFFRYLYVRQHKKNEHKNTEITLISPNEWGEMDISYKEKKEENEIEIRTKEKSRFEIKNKKSLSNPFATTIGNFELTAGKWYYEVIINSPSAFAQIGWGLYSQKNNDIDHGTGNDENGWSFNGNIAKILWHNKEYEYGKQWKEGDIVGCAIDIDNKIIKFYLNGKYLGVAFTKFDIKNGISPSITVKGSSKLSIVFDEDSLKYKPPIWQQKPLRRYHPLSHITKCM